jgi:hypothetical protein
LEKLGIAAELKSKIGSLAARRPKLARVGEGRPARRG